MTHVRPAAVAGMFYPGRARELQQQVRDLLAEAAATATASRALPKAIVAPHAGYVYSGPIAAKAYARLAPLAGVVRRVVLIGPAHRVAVHGLAAPGVDAFETPLGQIPLDRESIDDLGTQAGVRVWDVAHAEEHALEVQLPFLQELFGDFRLVPLLAGDASAEQVADVLDRLWGGPETLIVISSDLSHYLDYRQAQRLDAATCRAVEELDGEAIDWEQACGRVPLIGLLTLARRRHLTVETLDLRNSGDTAGDRRRVVGYGAWMFCEPKDAAAGIRSAEDTPGATDRRGNEQGLLDRHGATLLQTAAASIEHGLRCGCEMPVNAGSYPEELQALGASFVTLTSHGRLRGCIGSVEAYRPLVEDVARNGFAAAFHDNRFDRLGAGECSGLQLTVSVLDEPQQLRFDTEAELLAQLRVGRDGLVIRCNDCRGVFLPQVWDSVGDPGDFLRQLKTKAGLTPDYWSDDFRAWRFGVNTVSSTKLPPGALWS